MIGEGKDWEGTIYAESFGLGKVSGPRVPGVPAVLVGRGESKCTKLLSEYCESVVDALEMDGL